MEKSDRRIRAVQLVAVPLASLAIGGALIALRRAGDAGPAGLGPGVGVIVGGAVLTALIAVLMRRDSGRRGLPAATYLLTVRAAESTGLGLRLSPGIRPSEVAGRPGIGRMTQGSELELRRPDGTTSRTLLATFGIDAWADGDGSIYTGNDPADPEVRLFLDGELAPSLVPPGTEVWLLSPGIPA